MDVKKLYENLDPDSKLALNGLAQEINRKYERGERAGQEMGRVILFLGAAVHYHAPKYIEDCYPKAARPPLGGELGDLYIDDLFPRDRFQEENNRMKGEKLSLTWITQYYEELNDRPRLIERLSTFIGSKKPSPILKALAKMNFKYVVTTNYDHLFEDALSAVGKEYHQGIYKPNKIGLMQYTPDVPEKQVSVRKPFVFKLHGDIRDVVNDDGDYNYEKDAVVITDEDYLHFILRMSQITAITERNEIKEDMDMNYYPIPQSINNAFTGRNQNTFLFIGYGLRDYNLRLIFKTALWKKDTNIFKELQKWSIDIKPDIPIQNIFIKDYKLTFIQKDIWCAIPYLYSILFNEEMPLE